MTEQDLLTELERVMGAAGDENNGCLTLREICKACEKGEWSVRRALQMLNDEGKLEVIHLMRKNISGRWFQLPAYRIKKVD